ncbi:MAG TPA: hypothetical protein VFO73_07230 [Candidatus Limnocylindrales bacterium]|nr:hypothetical protein [Candidatus Limnocylindrales bacterium]
MRKSVTVIALALLATLGAYSPVAAAQTSNAKVVIIVGADTPQYLDDANSVYAEAIKYTPNVIKVYSPKATWSAVKAATTNANVVVYMGHGNGWPSPYTYDPNYTTKDGFGLNATAGTTHGNLKYYGEPSIRTLALAPNAVVFLFHLCYASGNSEPGQTAPKLSTAKARADNYATAFLRAGASVVIADGHRHSSYLTRLFTTTRTLDTFWRESPNYHNNEIRYTPTRASGTAILDPDNGPTNPSGYYRSIVGNLSVTTSAVIGQIPTGSITASRDETTTVSIQSEATFGRSTGGVLTRR